MIEVDTLKNQLHDLSIGTTQQRWLQRIAAGEFDAVLASPPCSTYSRAVWANAFGPRPLRSKKYRNGFPWLTGWQKQKAALGTTLARFACDAVCSQLHRSPTALALMEFPEDLGKVNGPPGAEQQQQASIWQDELLHTTMLEGRQVHSIGIHQSDWGTWSPKPTRLFGRLPGLNSIGRPGWPVFAADGTHLGPLPRIQTGYDLARTAHDKDFRTTGTAKRPIKLCEWISEAIATSTHNGERVISAVGDSSAGAERAIPGGKAAESVASFDKDEDMPELIEVGSAVEVTTASAPTHPGGGRGKPREVVFLGRTKEFHDGGGLCSPGRWDPKARVFPGGMIKDLAGTIKAWAHSKFSDKHMEQVIFKMALEKFKDSPFSEKDMEELRMLIFEAVKDQGKTTWKEFNQVEPGQPFFLEAMRAIQLASGDPDHHFLEQLKGGVTLGVLHPMPRTPAIFEEKTEWRLDEELEGAVSWAQNYSTLDLHLNEVEKQFEAEEGEGMMEALSEAEFHKKYGPNKFAIAALAVLQEKDKIRVLYDATHQVGTNHKIRMKDQLRMPGPGEKRLLLQQAMARHGAGFGICLDVSKAHRRIKILPEEWGFISCKVKDRIWANKVGTFGVSSASYWWGRLGAHLVRILHNLTQGGPNVEALLFADDLELTAELAEGRREIFIIIMVLCFHRHTLQVDENAWRNGV